MAQGLRTLWICPRVWTCFSICLEWVWRETLCSPTAVLECMSTSEMVRGNNLWMDEEKRIGKEVCGDISLSSLFCCYLFFFLWMFAGSFFSDAGSYMKWQMEPGYVLCVPQQSILHDSWLFNICRIELRFQNWLLDLDSLKKTWMDNDMESQASRCVYVVEVPRGQPEVVLVVF